MGEFDGSARACVRARERSGLRRQDGLVLQIYIRQDRPHRDGSDARVPLLPKLT